MEAVTVRLLEPSQLEKKGTNRKRYHLRTKNSKEFSETTNNVEASRVSFWTRSLDQGVNVSGERSTCVAPTFF